MREPVTISESTASGPIRGTGLGDGMPDGVDFRPLEPTDAEALCDLLLEARAADGAREPMAREEIRHHWYDRPGIRHETDSLVAIGRDGSMVGAVAVFMRPAPTTIARAFLPGAVRPDHRRHGVGTFLLRTAEARAQTLLGSAPVGQERQLDCESPASAADRIAFFEANGYIRARSFLIMHRDLAKPIPTPPLPPPLSFVEWRADLDEETRLAHNDAFRDHWGSEPIYPESWRHYGAAAPGFRSDCSWLALDGGTVAGYALATVSDGPAGRIGWLGTIGVRRAWRHQGVATALIVRSMASLAAAGATRAGLDVDGENPTGAVRVYESLGFARSEESIVFSKRI